MKKGRILLKGFFYVFLVLMLNALIVQSASAAPACYNNTICSANITEIKSSVLGQPVDLSVLSNYTWGKMLSNLNADLTYGTTLSCNNYSCKMMKGLNLFLYNYGKIYVYATTGDGKWHQIPNNWCDWTITGNAGIIELLKPGVVYGIKKGNSKVTCSLKADKTNSATLISTEPIDVSVGGLGAMLQSGGVLSYWWNDVENYFYTEPNPLQRKFGFNRLYDFGANLIALWYDTVRLEFVAPYRNTALKRWETQKWMIQLWKGTYGPTVGGEIGLYHKNLAASLYKCNDDDNLLNMSLTVYQQVGQNTIRLFTTPDDNYWWATGFKVWYDEYDSNTPAWLLSNLVNNATEASVFWHMNKYDLLFTRPNPQLTMLARITIPNDANHSEIAAGLKRALINHGFTNVSGTVGWQVPNEDHKDINQWPSNSNAFVIKGIPGDSRWDNIRIFFKWNYMHDRLL